MRIKELLRCYDELNEKVEIYLSKIKGYSLRDNKLTKNNVLEQFYNDYKRLEYVINGDKTGLIVYKIVNEETQFGEIMENHEFVDFIKFSILDKSLEDIEDIAINISMLYNDIINENNRTYNLNEELRKNFKEEVKEYYLSLASKENVDKINKKYKLSFNTDSNEVFHIEDNSFVTNDNIKQYTYSDNTGAFMPTFEGNPTIQSRFKTTCDFCKLPLCIYYRHVSELEEKYKLFEITRDKNEEKLKTYINDKNARILKIRERVS